MYGKDSSSIEWRRMAETYPESDGYTLFRYGDVSSISIHDTVQGYLGDCWVLAMISSIAEVPQRIWNLFENHEYNTTGIYSIRLYDMGVPISIVIDDYLPSRTNWEGVNNEYAKVNYEKELWSVLLEKAFAKLNGSYGSIVGGDPIHAGTNFMGINGGKAYHTSETIDALWSSISEWDSEDYILSALNIYSNNDGLIGSHAYSLIHTYTLSNTDRVVKLRNPHGKSEWTGLYGD